MKKNSAKVLLGILVVANVLLMLSGVVIGNASAVQGHTPSAATPCTDAYEVCIAHGGSYLACNAAWCVCMYFMYGYIC